MCERVDLEVRVYVTGRPGGQLEWQVVKVEPDGQTSWIDGQVSKYRTGVPMVPSALGRCVSKALRAVCREGRELR